MNTAPLIVERHGHVQVLALHAPGSRNALDTHAFDALQAALTDAADDADIGAIVLTGQDGYFSSGGNLNSLLSRRELPPAERRAALDRLHRLIRDIDALPKPVIAAVAGGAAGAGFSLALACDLIIAEQNSTFSIAYVKVGLTPDGGLTALLGQQIPRALLIEWSLTGEQIPAARLYELGVINHLTETGAALPHALTLAERLSAGPARASAAIKTLARQAATTPLAQQLDDEAQAMVAAQGDAESTEGISAFLQKRPSDFRKLRRSRPSTTPTTEIPS